MKVLLPLDRGQLQLLRSLLVEHVALGTFPGLLDIFDVALRAQPCVCQPDNPGGCETCYYGIGFSPAKVTSTSQLDADEHEKAEPDLIEMLEQISFEIPTPSKCEPYSAMTKVIRLDRIKLALSTFPPRRSTINETSTRATPKEMPKPPKAGDPVREDTLVLTLNNLVNAWALPPREGKGASIVAAARDVAQAFARNCLTLADGTCGSTRLCMHSRNSVQHSEWPSFTPHPQDPKRCYICGETEDFHGTAQNHCHPFVIEPKPAGSDSERGAT